MSSYPTSFPGAFIDNAWNATAPGTDLISVLDPATGKECGTVGGCSKAEADAALAAAQKAAPGWGSMPIDERAKHIANYAAKLKEHASEIKALLVAETGKVTSNAEYDFNMLIDCLPYHVEEVRRSYGAVVPSPDNSALSYTKHSPVGVVVAVLTWNFPLLNLGYKLGPILASGCTCVIKPSEVTPLATSRCVALAADAGLPPGVINLVNGTGLSLIEPLCASTVPRLLTTIGSTRMGRLMLGYSPTSIKRFSLELGGDAPVLVFADCDLDAAVDDIVGLKFANAGQVCVSPQRVMVQAGVYEAFVAKAQAKAAQYALCSGDGEKEVAAALQPIASEESLARLLGYVSDAQAKGARLVCGGARDPRPGFWMQPTILADVTDAMACQCEEIFGPILAVRAFDSEDEAFALANASELGLSGYVYTKSLATTLRAEDELQCGNVLINGAHYSIELPHGGLKQSGYGKDISHLSLRDYFDVRRVSIKRTR